MALYFDQNLSNDERLFRKKNEGFGVDPFGANTTIVPSKNIGNKILDNKDNVNFNEVVQYHAVNTIIAPTDNWKEVINGKLAARKMTEQTPINIVNFKIPLMLKYIGVGIDKFSYKPIPLNVFNGIYFFLIF